MNQNTKREVYEAHQIPAMRYLSMSQERFETPEWQAFLECSPNVSREALGDLIRVAIGWSKRMTIKPLANDLPDPAVDHCDWVAEMARLPADRWLNIHDYQVASKENIIRNMTAASERFSSATQEEVLEFRKGMLDGETINCYRMTDIARTFWHNGFEQGLSSQRIIKGWRALQGISEELKRPPDE